MAQKSNMSVKEKYERRKMLARERQRRYREKMSKEIKEMKKEYDRKRMERLKAEGTVKRINDMNPRDQTKQRKYLRDRNKVRSDKKKVLGAVTATPPYSSEGVQRESIQRRRDKPQIQASTSVSGDDSAPELQVSADHIPVLHCPSLETYSMQHFYPRTPVKITGCMNHWPALRKWTDLNYLVETAGNRTVPVELGSYVGSDWSQKLMSLRDFVTQHVTRRCQGDAPGYLAQHQLFDQIPELKRDIAVPDYCAFSDIKKEEDEEEEGEVDINAWFGPCGTVSPLHYDPKHNLLCQVVGRKRVILYAPSATDSLYPHEGRLLSNTARVDPEAPDYKTFPGYRNAHAFLCLLSPGEMLYIPPAWWHHVRSLDVSFSVSFWWA